MLFGIPASYFFYEAELFVILVGFVILFVALWRNKFVLRKKIVGLFLIGFVFCVVFYGSFVEPRRLVVREFEIENSRLPSMRVALVSDIHVGPYRGEDWVRRVVERVNGLGVEAVFLPGDFLFGKAGKFSDELEPLRDLNVSVKIATLGNHDHGVFEPFATEQPLAVSRALRDFGILELKNQSYFWGEKDVWVLGVDDNDFGFHDLRKAFAGVDDRPKILLAHSPDIVDELSDGVLPDLVLSGHTHCGQIRVPFLGALPFTIPTRSGKKFEGGFYEVGEVDLFVTCGVGEVGPRARLFNPPEIVVLSVNN